jgi:predicted nuclease of restriction endonuclease-like (RecB) superfamily
MNEIEESDILYKELTEIIQQSRQKVAIFVNSTLTELYWNIGGHITQFFLTNSRAAYGKSILQSVSAKLTEYHGKGFSERNLANMIKFYGLFKDKNILQTMSAKLSWSHFVEVFSLKEPIKREFYLQMAIVQKWDTRTLATQIDKMLFERTAIAQKSEEEVKTEIQKLAQNEGLSPDLVFKNTYVLDFFSLPHYHSEKELENALISNIQEFILELGVGFAFLERQKRITVDATDYHLDLLFFHRKLRRLIAIDLKIGKFKPEHKAQMELYLRWLNKNERQENEEKPIGLILCSEGNTEHIELLMLDENEIKVAQYLMDLPSKEWFADKLHRAIEIAKLNSSHE